MSFFDKLFGRKKSKPETPEALREALFDAAAGGAGRLEELCRAHRDDIVASFSGWTTVPPDVRTDPTAMQRYANGLISVARVFAASLGDPQLMQRLAGPPGANPLTRWQEQLGEARELMDALRYSEAAAILERALESSRGLSGSGVDQLLPITLGFLGECHFHGGEVERAAEPTREALALCEAHGDAEGVAVYLGNLYEIHRYLGEGAAAAGYAERLADTFAERGDEVQAAWYRSQGRILRRGAPAVRVVALIEGRRYELDELPSMSSLHVKFLFERDRITLKPAVDRTARGEELGSAGAYERALAAFRSAAAADPHDPHCRYLEALTLLSLERPAEAITSYEACEARAPGFFHCRADLWLAREIAGGRLDHGAFLALRSLEDETAAPEERARLARKALARYPKLPALHLALGEVLARMGKHSEAEAAYREGLALAQEPDVRSRLLVALGGLIAPGDESRRLLVEAVELNGNLTAAATARVILRQTP
jgi:tetratricopeptide (TPR) repeat protein